MRHRISKSWEKSFGVKSPGIITSVREEIGSLLGNPVSTGPCWREATVQGPRECAAVEVGFTPKNRRDGPCIEHSIKTHLWEKNKACVR